MATGWDVSAGELHWPGNNLCAKKSSPPTPFSQFPVRQEREMRELMYFKRKDECSLLSDSEHLFIIQVKVKHDARKVGKVSCLICLLYCFWADGKDLLG